MYLIHAGKKYNSRTRNWDWLPYRAHLTADGQRALCGALISVAGLTSTHATLDEWPASIPVTQCRACRQASK